jgi:hypothetical protein
MFRVLTRDRVHPVPRELMGEVQSMDRSRSEPKKVVFDGHRKHSVALVPIFTKLRYNALRQ